MSDKLIESPNWQELRDDRNKLCGRIEARLLLLEIRRNHDTAIFDLREYIDLLRSVDRQENLC